MEIVGVSQVIKNLSSVASSSPSSATTPTSSLTKQSQIDENDDHHNITINPSSGLSEHCSSDNKKLTADEYASLKCGFFNWKPQFMQRFMTVQSCLVFLCLAGAVQGMSVIFNIFRVHHDDNNNNLSESESAT